MPEVSLAPARTAPTRYPSSSADSPSGFSRASSRELRGRLREREADRLDVAGLARAREAVRDRGAVEGHRLGRSFERAPNRLGRGLARNRQTALVLRAAPRGGERREHRERRGGSAGHERPILKCRAPACRPHPWPAIRRSPASKQASIAAISPPLAGSLMSGIRTNAAAELLGVSANTLRSWERRFGYPAPRRTEGGHRQYDLSDLEALRRALLETHNISSAIEIAASAARARPRPSGWSRPSTASTTRPPTAPWRRASRSARSSGRSRSCCCRRIEVAGERAGPDRRARVRLPLGDRLAPRDTPGGASRPCATREC